MWHPTICVVFLVLMHESGKGFVLAYAVESSTGNGVSPEQDEGPDAFSTPLITNICKQDMKIVPCRSDQDPYENRYFYNHDNNNCETYQGCVGDTQNNFKSWTECVEACKAQKTPDSSSGTSGDTPKTTSTGGTTGTVHATCQEHPSSINCQDNKLPVDSFYFFDIKKKYCSKFSGCAKKTDNYFKSKSECYSICVLGETPATYGTTQTMAKDTMAPNFMCHAQKDAGPCKEPEVKFYFDPISKKCKEFLYGGCGGTLNKFGTKQDCIKNCLGEGATVHPTDTTMETKTIVITGYTDGKSTTRIWPVNPTKIPSATQTITRPLD